MNEELLEAALSLLKSKVDVVMYDINNILSVRTYHDNMAKKLATKISKLSKANYNYQQGISLKAQIMKIQIENLVSKVESEEKK